MSEVLGSDFANTFETQEKREEERLREAIFQNPLDFDSWLDLIKHIENYKTADLNIQIYREFLKEYPLCYGYWRKLAEIYAVQSQDEHVISVYEEALLYLPHCVELWVPYSTWKAARKSEDEARELFDRAVQACGKIFNGTLLWDKYIEFEKSKKRFDRVGKLFWRILQIPTTRLHDYYKRFRNFIEARGRKMEHYGANLPPQPAADEVDPNDPHYNSKIEMLFSARCEEAKQSRIKEIVRQYEATVQEYNKRRIFELNIKRHFFHSKALDEIQLSNWRDYCEFEERQGDDERIRLLYERCIVPTCYYTEFWVRYANYLHRTESEESARRLFIRANTHFLSRRPWLFVSQGHFEEMLGNLDEARRLYKLVYEDKGIIYSAPGYFDAIFKHLNLERRENNFYQVEKLYELAYDIAISSGQDPLLVFVTKHYAEYLLQHKNDVHSALTLFEDVLQRISSRKSLFLGYILFLRHLPDLQERLYKARDTFEKSISKDSQLVPQEKEEMWLLYLDYMRDHWTDINTIQTLETRFQHKYCLAFPYASAFSFVKLKRPSGTVIPATDKKIKH